MLLDDRGILDGHRPAAELDEPGAVRLVPREEGSPERGVAGHGAVPSRWGEASNGRRIVARPGSHDNRPAARPSREARPDIPSLSRKPRADLRSRLDVGGWSVAPPRPFDDLEEQAKPGSAPSSHVPSPQFGRTSSIPANRFDRNGT